MKFSQVQKLFDEYRLYADRGVVRMVAASVIANQLVGRNKKPVWIVFVAPPGGGKSDVTGTLVGVMKKREDGAEVRMCQEISDLTTTSLASGMRSLDGETSLLHNMPKEGGILLFKDFTTLLSKRQDDLAAIMSYLREIYDGSFEKKFGNGKKVHWEGKLGVVASCTTIIYHKLSELSVMGDRMMMYQIDQPDRQKVQDKIWENEDAGIDGSIEMGDAMKEYVEGIMAYIDGHRDEIGALNIDRGLREEFGLVADFTTTARSGVVWNYKKDTISYVPDVEMPTRVLRQMISISVALMVMNMAESDTGEPSLGEIDLKLIYKLAFDSIPNMRRKVIRTVATYALGATSDGIASAVGMQHEAVKVWIEELYAVGVFERALDVVTKKYKYSVVPRFMDVIRRYEHIEQVDRALESDDGGDVDGMNF